MKAVVLPLLVIALAAPPRAQSLADAASTDAVVRTVTIDPAIIAPRFTVLHHFDLFTEGGTPSVAEALTLLGDTLYGATTTGGANGKGTLFSVRTSGATYAVIHAFSSFAPDGTNVDGAFPFSTLTQAGNKLYGTATAGGTFGNGVLYSLNPDGTGLTELFNFTGAPLNSAGGKHSPFGELVLSGDILYGVTRFGGSPAYDGSLYGRIFAVDTGGGGTIRYAFPDVTWDGNHLYSPYAPVGGLVQLDTKLYGATSFGGYDDHGTLFTVNTDGSGYSTMHLFMNVDGANPTASLALSGDTLYGTTTNGGSDNRGVIFAMNVNGSGFTVLHTFTLTDGYSSQSRLLVSGDTLYGSTVGGGSTGYGTVFSMKADGTNYSILHSFDRFVDGAGPSRLIQVGRKLYGMASSGGSHDYGTIFRLSLDPSLGFTDDPMIAGSNVIRAVHVTELRTRIDAQRALRRLATFAWNDPTLVLGVSIVRAQHIIDLRVALAEVYTADGLTPSTYTDPSLQAGMAMTVAHIAEVRTAVVAIE